MRLNTLELINFKKFSNLKIEFSNRLNFIIGKNGSGKTTIAEAISYLSIPRSFRNVRDESLIKFGESGFSIKANISNLIEHNIQIIYKKGEFKMIIVDGKRIKTFLKLFETFTVLTFHSYNYTIIEQSPSIKRRFFDWFFSLLDYEYFINLYKYKKILEQKNKALKTKEEISIWNKQLKQFANNIVKMRESFIKKINSIILEQNDITLNYQNSLERNSFEKALELEIKKGFSIVGPHRDNYEFLYKGYSARMYASEGERRKIFLDLVFAMIKITKEIKKIEPVVVFDEPFNVLDEENFMDFLRKIERLDLQIIITSIKKPNNINANIIELKN